MAKDTNNLKSNPPRPEITLPPSFDDASSAADDHHLHPLLDPPPPCFIHRDELYDKCAAFARCDMYGPMGCGELPLVEELLLGVAIVTLVPLRIVIGVNMILLYYSIIRVCMFFNALCEEGIKGVGRRGSEEEEEEDEEYMRLSGWRRKVVMHSGRFMSRIFLFVLGFYRIKHIHRYPKSMFQDKGKRHHEHKRPGVIISNHVSYLDIVYHMSSSFPSFVAKRSVAEIPIVGNISKCLGCIYVQRESKSMNFRGVSGVVSKRVEEAEQNEDAPVMLLFPEGTTTNGEYLLPFKTGAFVSKAPVLPIILRYPFDRFSPAWESISGFANHMEVIHLPIYYPSEIEKDNPQLYAENVRRLMAKEGGLVLSDVGLVEKRIYLAVLSGNNILLQKD